MPPQFNPGRSYLCFLAGKLSSLSETEISLLADDALERLIDFELSRRPENELTRILEAEISPFEPILEVVIQGVLSEIFRPPKPRAKAKEEEQTTHPPKGLIPSNRPVNCSKYSTTEEGQGLKGIGCMRKAKTFFGQDRLIDSNRPIFCSKYSRSADVQGLKGIKYHRKAKTFFGQLHKVEQDQEGTSRAVV